MAIGAAGKGMLFRSKPRVPLPCGDIAETGLTPDPSGERMLGVSPIGLEADGIISTRLAINGSLEGCLLGK